jgi:hypothetical protein
MKINGVRQKKFLSTIKVSGSCQKNMSSILNNLGIEEDNPNWYKLALCLGMDTNLFFDKYESDINIARTVDEACLSCPVIAICYENGINNNDYGVWGGVYLNSGSIDKVRNSHKTKEVWKRLKAKHVY